MASLRAPARTQAISNRGRNNARRRPPSPSLPLEEKGLQTDGPLPSPRTERQAGTNDRLQGMSSELEPPSGVIDLSLAAQPASLPCACAHLPPATVQKIRRGQYVNFAQLLPSRDGHDNGSAASARHVEVRSTEADTFTISTQGSPRRQISDLATWLEAFTIFASTCTMVAPDRAPALWAYQDQVLTAGRRYHFHAVLGCDRKFRQLAEQDPTLQWDRRDPDLHTEAFTSQARTGTHGVRQQQPVRGSSGGAPSAQSRTCRGPHRAADHDNTEADDRREAAQWHTPAVRPTGATPPTHACKTNDGDTQVYRGVVSERYTHIPMQALIHARIPTCTLSH